MKNQKKNPQQLNEAIFLLPAAVWGLKALGAYLAYEMVVGVIFHDSVSSAEAATISDGYKQRMKAAYNNQARYFNKYFPNGPKQFKKKYPNDPIPGGVYWKQGKEKGVFDRWLDVNDSVWNTDSAESYWKPHKESWLLRTELIGYNKNSQRKVGILPVTGLDGQKQYYYEGDYYRAFWDRDYTPGGDPEKRRIGKAKRSLANSVNKIRTQMEKLKTSNPEAYKELQAQYDKKVKEIKSLGPGSIAKLARPFVGKNAERKASQIASSTIQAVKKSKELEKTKNNQSQDKDIDKNSATPASPSKVGAKSVQKKSTKQPSSKNQSSSAFGPIQQSEFEDLTEKFEQYFKNNQQILEQIENKKLYNLIAQEVDLLFKK